MHPVVETFDELPHGDVREPEGESEQPRDRVLEKRFLLGARHEMVDRIVSCSMTVDANYDHREVGRARECVRKPADKLTGALREWKVPEMSVSNAYTEPQPDQQIEDAQIHDEVVVVGSKSFLDAERRKADDVREDDQAGEDGGKQDAVYA